MNDHLKREIVKNIFNVVGVLRGNMYAGSSLIAAINSNEFLIDKKLVFDNEDGERKGASIWAAIGKIDKNEIKLILTDIGDEVEEFALIVKMDNYYSCALRLSLDEADFGSMFFHVGDKWVAMGTSHQAKILVGVENLAEIFVLWEKMENWKDMYKELIGFLNFEETANG